jgi:hypothetical protein
LVSFGTQVFVVQYSTAAVAGGKPEALTVAQCLRPHAGTRAGAKKLVDVKGRKVHDRAELVVARVAASDRDFGHRGIDAALNVKRRR